MFLNELEAFNKVFFINDIPTRKIYTLSLHDALPISSSDPRSPARRTVASICMRARRSAWRRPRSEEHTSELQSRRDLVCRLLLEKKKDSSRINGKPSRS